MTGCSLLVNTLLGVGMSEVICYWLAAALIVPDDELPSESAFRLVCDCSTSPDSIGR
jgi:hypothetical protein